MRKPNITCKEFYILHQCIVEQAEKLLRNLGLGGLEYSSDEYFYGYNSGGKLSKTSINSIVFESLKSKGYDFSKFSKDENGETKFNKDILRKAKNAFNNRQGDVFSSDCKIYFSARYLKVFLFFIGYDSIKTLVSDKQSLPIRKTINPANSSRQVSIKKGRPPEFFNEDRNLHQGWEKAIKSKLENTKWCLYTYNYSYKTIVKAILEIENLGDGKNYVYLKNPENAYEYIGTVNCRLAYRQVIQFDLVTEFADDKHLHSKFYIDFTKKGTPLMLGQQIGYGDHHDINCTNAILCQAEKNDQARYYKKPFKDLPSPAIRKFLDSSVEHFRKIPRHTFYTFKDLDQWIENSNDS